MLWASVAVETLARLGLSTAIVCPGSRSTSLTLALASHPDIEAIPILDERSAAFFALGCARRLHQPVVLVCTSGTAGANFYPAIIEARESRAPLIVLTADRPPELRDCASGQTIDQQKLFGAYPVWYAELAIPSLERLAYLRQTMVQAWVRSQPGPVHLNCPYRDPLAPLPEAAALALANTLDEAHFFASVTPPPVATPQLAQLPWADWQRRGVIIAGPAQPPDPQRYCEAVGALSQHLGWPVLAEGLSPLRNHQALNPHLIWTYDSLLRQPDWANTLKPDSVIQLGPLPTSKALRQWLADTQPQRWIIDPSDTNLDPLHGPTRHLRTCVEALTPLLSHAPLSPPPCPYLNQWQTLNQQLSHQLNHTLAQLSDPFEGKAAWLLSQTLPPDTPVIIANSMPVRDVESFWQPNHRRLRPYFNRGANGIDGTLSTALGVAHRDRPSVLLTGDLAFLHDTNGLLTLPQFQGHLTIVLINNQGGGIFEMLPIAQFEPPFEQYFATPQTVALAPLCQAYGVEHTPIQDWSQLAERLTALPARGVRLLEFKTDRKQDAARRRRYQALHPNQTDHRYTFAAEDRLPNHPPGNQTGDS